MSMRKKILLPLKSEFYLMIEPGEKYFVFELGRRLA